IRDRRGGQRRLPRRQLSRPCPIPFHPHPFLRRLVDREDKPSELAEAALALDRELRKFEDLAAQAGRLKLSSEKNLERATEPRTQQIAEEAEAIARTAEEKEMEDVARQAEVLRQQILSAKNRIALLSPKARA